MSGIKRAIKQNPTGRYLAERQKQWRYRRYARRYSDRQWIERLYQRSHDGQLPNLDDPKTFTEKLQWLKLFYRDPAIPHCTDKLEAKTYVAARGFPELIVPTLAVFDNAGEIDATALPDRFMLKASHGSNWNISCRRKSRMDWEQTRRMAQLWLRDDLSVYGREWNYHGLTPRLFAEEWIGDGELIDCKLLCFHGAVRAVQVNQTHRGKLFVDFYDEDWRWLADLSIGICPRTGQPLSRPVQFEQMKATAAVLAQPFPFVRVDFCVTNEKLYFSEMTFFPGSGFWNIQPKTYDRAFGELLILPDRNA